MTAKEAVSHESFLTAGSGLPAPRQNDYEAGRGGRERRRKFVKWIDANGGFW